MRYIIAPQNQLNLQEKSDKSDEIGVSSAPIPPFFLRKLINLAISENDRDTTKRKKELFLAIYSKTYWGITSMTKAIGISRDTYYEWMKDPNFSNAIKEIDKWMNDWAEDYLKEAIIERKHWAIKLFLEHRHPDYKK